MLNEDGFRLNHTLPFPSRISSSTVSTTARSHFKTCQVWMGTNAHAQRRRFPFNGGYQCVLSGRYKSSYYAGTWQSSANLLVMCLDDPANSIRLTCCISVFSGSCRACFSSSNTESHSGSPGYPCKYCKNFLSPSLSTICKSSISVG